MIMEVNGDILETNNSKSDVNSRVINLTEKLEAGMKDLLQSDKYMSYLKSMSQFHTYSARNIMLIHIQCPNATMVGSFKLWKDKFNRHVKKGEKAIQILAPVVSKVSKDESKDTPAVDPETNAPLLDENGNAVMEEQELKTLRFRIVSVFDVSQTDGDPIPTLVEDLTGNVAHYEAFIDTLRAVSTLPIVFEALPENQDGYCHFGDHIGIREDMSETQTVLALVHEIVHSRLHDPGTLGTDKKSSREMESESEAVAYVVCQRYQIETASNSFGYLTSWNSRDMKEFKASLETIRNESSRLITEIDEQFKIISNDLSIGVKFEVPEVNEIKEVMTVNEKNDSYSIYQLKSDDDHRFEPFERLNSLGLTIDRDDYDLIYTAPLTDADTLDSIYMKFNIDHPADYTGRSLSVSDVVVIERGGETTSYYVDTFGFAELPEFTSNEKQPEISKPVYMETLAYAREHNELDMYIESRNLNVECRNAINTAISESRYDTNFYRMKDAVKNVVDNFGSERTELIMAKIIGGADWDGRYSGQNKEWAKGFEIPHGMKDIYSDTHPCLLDGFVDRIREKPSVIETLKANTEKSREHTDVPKTTGKSKQTEVL